MTPSITIDRLDAEIIRRLTENARAGIAELATRLGVARNTVQSRVRRLEEAGLITGYSPTLDLEVAGVVFEALVGMELDQRRLADVVTALTGMPQVLEVNTLAGREDLLVRVAALTHTGLQDAVTTMIAIRGVRHTTTTLIVSTPVRYRTQPVLDLLTRESGFGRSTALPDS